MWTACAASTEETSLFDDRDHSNGNMDRLQDRLLARRDRLARSGLLTVFSLLLVLAVLGALWMAHLQGRIHKLTTTQEVPEQTAPVVRPGGQDIVRLSRFEVAGSMAPQFTGAALAPGYGMLMLQAALTLPGRGEMPVLLGTREVDLSTAGDNLQGAEFSATVQSREGSRWSTPVEVIAGRPSSRQNTAILPGGSRSDTHFSPDVTVQTGNTIHTGVQSAVSVTMTSRGLELELSAKNVSPAPRAVTLAWLPRFLVSQAGMLGMSVLPPQQASSTIARDGIQLGIRDVDQTFTALQHSYLSAGPEVLLQNQADGYVLRFTAVTSSIRSVHISAGVHQDAVLVAFSTAASEKKDEERTVLAPGETLHWRLRIEAVPTSTATSPTP